MDEFKDYEDDLKNYPDRPLPSGRVQRVDLWVLLGAIILAVAALNLTPPPVAWAAAGVFAYSLLMFKWFFIEKRMRASLPLALYTHNPIVYIYFAYLFVTYTVVNSDFALSHFAIALPLGAGLTNWEVSRKIRLAENETAYTTYSKIWGFKGAIFVCLTIQSVVMSGMQWYFVATSTPVWLRFAFTVLYLGLSAKFVQFLTVSTDPDGKWSKLLPLRKFSEYQAVLVQCTVIIAYLLHFFN